MIIRKFELRESLNVPFAEIRYAHLYCEMLKGSFLLEIDGNVFAKIFKTKNSEVIYFPEENNNLWLEELKNNNLWLQTTLSPEFLRKNKTLFIEQELN